MWIIGLSGSGKLIVVCVMDYVFLCMGKLCYVLDGDNIWYGLCKDLGFLVKDWEENIWWVGEVVKLFVDVGLVMIVSCILLYRRDREFVCGLLNKGDFVEVYMKVLFFICEKWDCKGLYKLVWVGVIKGFMGIDDFYEVLDKFEVVLEVMNVVGEFVIFDCMVEIVIDFLIGYGLFLKELVWYGCMCVDCDFLSVFIVVKKC